jgi:hypothetical protein
MLVCSGCIVGTSQPLYDSARDTVFDPKLVGTWGNSECRMRIRAAPDKGYEVLEVLPGQAAAPQEAVRAELVPIGKYRYLFLKAPDSVGTLLWPCFRVSVGRGGLRMQSLNVVAMEDYLTKHPEALRHEMLRAEGPATQPATQPALMNFIITDSPAKVRAFIEAHQDDADFVDEGMILADLNPIT